MSLHVVVPSANADNLVRCLGALFERDPAIAPEQVVVVDDGARRDAEARLPRGIRWVSGQRPFVYARNLNAGVAAAGRSDVLVLGDDVELVTRGGVDQLAEVVTADPGIGIVAASVDGAVGNPRQRAGRGRGLQIERDMVAFVCVLVTAEAWRRVGGLDERFTGYGYDDADFCWRTRRAGLGIAIHDACVVRHDGSLPSSFRTRRDFRRLNLANQQRMLEKWGALPESGVFHRGSDAGAERSRPDGAVSGR